MTRPPSTTPHAGAGYRAQLSRGENVIDPETWAGSMPAAQGIAPRVRVGRERWFNLLWLLPIGFVVLITAVAIAQGLRNMPAVQRFIERYPGSEDHRRLLTVHHFAVVDGQRAGGCPGRV